MANWNGLKMIKGSDSKTVIMDYVLLKKLLFFIILFFFVLAFFNSFDKKIFFSNQGFMSFLFMIILLFLFYYPGRFVIMKKNDKSFVISKRGAFFISINYYISPAQNIVLVTRRRSMFKGRIVFTNYNHQLLVRYTEKGKIREINPTFISYFAKNGSMSGLVKKEQAQEISKFLGVKLIVENV